MFIVCFVMPTENDIQIHLSYEHHAWLFVWTLVHFKCDHDIPFILYNTIIQ